MWCIQIITTEYRKRMYNLFRLYSKEYNPEHPLIGMDEKSKQLLEDSRPSIKGGPGKLAKLMGNISGKEPAIFFLQLLRR
jgi:hypothetical protein